MINCIPHGGSPLRGCLRPSSHHLHLRGRNLFAFVTTAPALATHAHGRPSGASGFIIIPLAPERVTTNTTNTIGGHRQPSLIPLTSLPLPTITKICPFSHPPTTVTTTCPHPHTSPPLPTVTLIHTSTNTATNHSNRNHPHKHTLT